MRGSSVHWETPQRSSSRENNASIKPHETIETNLLSYELKQKHESQGVRSVVVLKLDEIAKATAVKTFTLIFVASVSHSLTGSDVLFEKKGTNLLW